MKTKHVFVTGGVVSSLGKGITAAALAFLLDEVLEGRTSNVREELLARAKEMQ